MRSQCSGGRTFVRTGRDEGDVMSRRQCPTEPSSGDCQGPLETSTDRARLSAIQGRQIRIRTCRTAGACGFMTDTHDIANTTDEEFSDDDLIRLRKLEKLLLDRGYVRDKHGFWT